MRSMRQLITFCLSLSVSVQIVYAEKYDVVVYGGTSAAVTAAVQAKRLGKTVVIVSPDQHLGGLSSGGLGWTDTGNKAVIGGLTRDFYHRVWKHYQKKDAWTWQKQNEYGDKGQGTPAIDGKQRTMWIFEPHVAEQVFEDFVREYQIPLFRNEWLDRKQGVKMSGKYITSITTLSGKTFAGRMFIDATYEGDLMATAGVSYHVGREGKNVYGEEWNGVQTGILHHKHHFGPKAVKETISAYRMPGDTSSGLLPRISGANPGKYGSGDGKIQAYCFRMCLTNHEANRVPFAKPAGYDADRYELLLRIYQAGWRETFAKFDPIPNYKTDTNNHGPMSTDNIGYNYDYPEASYDRRKEIIKEHETYQKGWLYFIANDPRVPQEVQQKMRQWGLARDEFKDNGNWPHQLYIREARRMVGQFVMTEHELLKKRPTPDSVGMGSYTMDSHNVQRYVTPEGFVQNEGDIGVSTHGPYKIAYGSLVPKKGECGNLLVPVCVSSSHIAFGSIRMEPVFMILGHSAATAAGIALEQNLDVQDVPYSMLSEKLLKEGQILETPPEAKYGRNGVDPAKLKGIVIDDSQARLTGAWETSRSSKKFIGTSYSHESNLRDGKAAARFETKIPKAGRYEVRFAYTPHSNRSSKVKIKLIHASGEAEQTINQKKIPPLDGVFISLGEYEFSPDQTAVVKVTNANADGYVIIDAVQWIPVSN
ncbi:FAD-dependent oxidoreductase [uncultured Gimesia sp.]|uniref:FAD-dependent oxidoreductase n=1 Tax=uncultured Gimesia sp. TaxID=1678688 RepID=UPI00260DBA24|nr:FAD-dependent oxidoreductase [uncultured Gimesia sp.]